MPHAKVAKAAKDSDFENPLSSLRSLRPLREAKFIGVMPLALSGLGLLTSAAALSLAVIFSRNFFTLIYLDLP